MPDGSPSPPARPAAARPPRWLRYGLRSLLLLPVLAAVAALAWLHYVERHRVRQLLADDIAKLGGSVKTGAWNGDDNPPGKDAADLAATDRLIEVQLPAGGWQRFRRGAPSESLGDVDNFEDAVRLLERTSQAGQGAPGSAFLRAEEARRDALADCLARLAELGDTQRLSLTWNGVTDEQVAQVAQMKGLRRLDLSYTQVTDAGLAHLAQLTDLEHLSLYGCWQVSDAGAAHLAVLKNLQTLDLGETSVSDGALSAVRGLPKLSHLYLDGTGVADVDLRGLPHLVHLDLSDTSLKALRLDDAAQLRSLDLSGSPAGDETLRSLDGLKSVEQLDVAGTRITPAGLAHLAGWSHLARLLADQSVIRDGGEQHLKKLPGLRVLELRGPSADAAELQALQEQLPQVRIYGEGT